MCNLYVNFILTSLLVYLFIIFTYYLEFQYFLLQQNVLWIIPLSQDCTISHLLT